MNLRDYVFENKRKEHLYSQSFQLTFGVPLKKYMDFITGFDIVKFDKDMGTPDGQSLAGFLTEKYGEEAKKLVENLI